MPKSTTGDIVNVHYTGTLDNGTVFDSSLSREPLQFTLGEGQVIPGFEHAVTGLEPGDSTTVHIPAEEAYGPCRADLIAAFPRDQFPPDMVLTPGEQLQMQQPNGQALVVTVTEVADDKITLDANHPLAGQALNFDLTLVSIGA
ncbi:MAG TPA: peptidylprolyl isomerase [Armatimonadota bacterium]|jgi:FKBP-type peptidyl-prolyl cis-trans isomerase 2